MNDVVIYASIIPLICGIHGKVRKPPNQLDFSLFNRASGIEIQKMERRENQIYKNYKVKKGKGKQQ